jgi:hypothetical protein
MLLHNAQEGHPTVVRGLQIAFLHRALKRVDTRLATKSRARAADV